VLYHCGAPRRADRAATEPVVSLERVTGPDSPQKVPDGPGPVDPDQVESLPGTGASAIEVEPASTGPLAESAVLTAPGPMEPVIHEDPAAAAFFDLDNTVIQGASLFYLAKGLYRRDFFPTRVIFKGLWLQAYFRLIGREKASHIEDVRNVTLGFIAGRQVSEVEAVGEEIYEESIASRIWPGTRAIAQEHIDVGQQVWLVTAAPVELAGVIAARLGLTGAVGTTAEHVDGVYTGRLRGQLLHGPAKAEAVRALAREHGLDLARCFAYSDSYNDLPMLSLVGHPCAINPDGRLRAHAEENDWQIRDYRTGRKAVRFGLFGAGATGAAAGAVAAGLAVRRALRS
jgi:HAD superfamily hydrolase (TIGR01490 family)